MTKEALRMALEALEAFAIQGDVACVVTNDGEIYLKPVITAIKEALAQPEHGWTPERIAGMARLKDVQDKRLTQSTWSGLTDEEVNKLVDDEDWYNFPHEFAKAVEAKLKEKNA